MNSKFKRIVLQAAGGLFVVVGTLGLALPFLQGLLFIAIGLILLSLAHPRMREWLKARTQRFPRLHSYVERLENWLVNKIGPL